MDHGDVELGQAVRVLSAFLGGGPLTAVISQLERDLDGEGAPGASAIVQRAGLTPQLLAASVVTRDNFGRLNDLIHALGISLALPHLLDDGERIANRPSLAAGNDPSRPYDLETDRRVAEFKFSVWTGRDAMRKRQTFKDFVHLAADRSGRHTYLYVLGQRPIRFLRSTKSSAEWGLDRSPATRELFQSRFGDLSVPISTFVAAHERVKVVDLAGVAPELFGRLAT